MSTTATRMTAEEFAVWDPGGLEGDWGQLIEGEVVVSVPKPMHQVLEVRLLVAVNGWIESGMQRGLVLSNTALTLDDRNVYAPDVLWFREENRPVDLYRYPEGLSDLCAEIRSPSTWRYDIGAKRAAYERTGLPELWLVDDLAEVVLVYRRSEPKAAAFDVALELARGDTLSSPMMPGFALALEQLFRR